MMSDKIDQEPKPDKEPKIHNPNIPRPLTQRESHVRSMLKGARARLAYRTDMLVSKVSTGYFPLSEREWECFKRDADYKSIRSTDPSIYEDGFISWAAIISETQYLSVTLAHLAIMAGDYATPYFEVVSLSHHHQGVTKAEQLLMGKDLKTYVETQFI